MANLILLRNLLPDMYKVMGTPSKVLIISPFKTPFGYLEAIVEETEKGFVIYNTDIPSEFIFLGFDNLIKRFRDFTVLPVKIDTDPNDPRIWIEVESEGTNKDLITLAKTVDEFIRDLNDFIRSMIKFEEVKRKLGTVDLLLFKFAELKEKQKEKLKEKAEKIRYEIVDLYDQIKAMVLAIEESMKKGKYSQAAKLTDEAIALLGKLDHLRGEYKRLTGKDFYGFHSEVLRNTLFELKEKLESSS